MPKENPESGNRGWVHSLAKLAFDTSNLSFAVFEQDRKVDNFDEKLLNALDFEQCDDVHIAIGIISIIDCYNYVPYSNMCSIAEEFMPKWHDTQPEILAVFNYEAFAANHLRTTGMYEVDGDFLCAIRLYSITMTLSLLTRKQTRSSETTWNIGLIRNSKDAGRSTRQICRALAKHCKMWYITLSRKEEKEVAAWTSGPCCGRLIP